ncbi:hypothetical protein M569_15373 [Genlisea aurea]|uniref:Uncharacterized protein n=1 Tax=Genlisea aurea TaxID=192259 RepID=S8BXX5_9LAMI|nr:hypothetical protein M569_15373 [Genlisea aurea]
MSSTQIISDNLEEVMASRSAAGAAADYALLSYADGRAVSLADSSPMQVSVHLDPATDQEAQETISCLSYFPMIGNSVPAAVAGALKLLSENPAIQKVVSSPMGDKNIWEALMHDPEVKKMSSGCIKLIMAAQKSFTRGHLEGALAPVASGIGNFFHKVWQFLVDLLSKFAAFFTNIFLGDTDDRETALLLGADMPVPYRVILGLTLVGILEIIIQRVIDAITDAIVEDK